jgi:hypothetical protein
MSETQTNCAQVTCVCQRFQTHTYLPPALTIKLGTWLPQDVGLCVCFTSEDKQ